MHLYSICQYKNEPQDGKCIWWRNLIPSPSHLGDPFLLNKVRASADGDNLVCWIQQSGLINVLLGEGGHKKSGEENVGLLECLD